MQKNIVIPYERWESYKSNETIKEILEWIEDSEELLNAMKENETPKIALDELLKTDDIDELLSRIGHRSN